MARFRHFDQGSETASAGQTGSSDLTVRYTQTCSNRVDTRDDLREQDRTLTSDRVLTRGKVARFRHFDHDPETPVPLAEALAPYTAKTDARRAGRAVNW